MRYFFEITYRGVAEGRSDEKLSETLRVVQDSFDVDPLNGVEVHDTAVKLDVDHSSLLEKNATNE